MDASFDFVRRIVPETVTSFIVSTAYFAIPVHFTGTGPSDVLLRGAGMTGDSTSKLVTFSGWIKVDEEAVNYVFGGLNSAAGGNSARGFGIIQNTAELLVRGRSVGTTNVLQFNLANGFTVAAGWQHFLMSFDLSDTNKRHLYINDIVQAPTYTVYTDAEMQFTQAADWAVGGQGDDFAMFEGGMADIWFAEGVYIDFASEANRRKFISSVGKPVYLGSSGSIPTGISPNAFFSGPVDEWHINKGTGGGFTETGTLTRYPTSPSD